MDLTVIRRFRDPWAATLAKSRLEAAGLQAVLLDENIVAQNWLYSQAVGGVRLCVRREDVDVARDLLGGESAPSPPRGGFVGKAALFSLLLLGPLTLLLGAVALLTAQRSRDSSA